MVSRLNVCASSLKSACTLFTEPQKNRQLLLKTLITVSQVASFTFTLLRYGPSPKESERLDCADIELQIIKTLIPVSEFLQQFKHNPPLTNMPHTYQHKKRWMEMVQGYSHSGEVENYQLGVFNMTTMTFHDELSRHLTDESSIVEAFTTVKEALAELLAHKHMSAAVETTPAKKARTAPNTIENPTEAIDVLTKLFTGGSGNLVSENNGWKLLCNLAHNCPSPPQEVQTLLDLGRDFLLSPDGRECLSNILTMLKSAYNISPAQVAASSVPELYFTNPPPQGNFSEPTNLPMGSLLPAMGSLLPDIFLTPVGKTALQATRCSSHQVIDWNNPIQALGALLTRCAIANQDSEQPLLTEAELKNLWSLIETCGNPDVISSMESVRGFLDDRTILHQVLTSLLDVYKQESPAIQPSASHENKTENSLILIDALLGTCVETHYQVNKGTLDSLTPILSDEEWPTFCQLVEQSEDSNLINAVQSFDRATLNCMENYSELIAFLRRLKTIYNDRATMEGLPSETSSQETNFEQEAEYVEVSSIPSLGDDNATTQSNIDSNVSQILTRYNLISTLVGEWKNSKNPWTPTKEQITSVKQLVNELPHKDLKSELPTFESLGLDLTNLKNTYLFLSFLMNLLTQLSMDAILALSTQKKQVFVSEDIDWSLDGFKIITALIARCEKSERPILRSNIEIVNFIALFQSLSKEKAASLIRDLCRCHISSTAFYHYPSIFFHLTSPNGDPSDIVPLLNKLRADFPSNSPSDFKNLTPIDAKIHRNTKLKRMIKIMLSRFNENRNLVFSAAEYDAFENAFNQIPHLHVFQSVYDPKNTLLRELLDNKYAEDASFSLIFLHEFLEEPSGMLLEIFATNEPLPVPTGSSAYPVPSLECFTGALKILDDLPELKQHLTTALNEGVEPADFIDLSPSKSTPDSRVQQLRDRYEKMMAWLRSNASRYTLLKKD